MWAKVESQKGDQVRSSPSTFKSRKSLLTSRGTLHYVFETDWAGNCSN